ncbi:FAD-binding protein [bacterium]|nr:FAD-binding protein [bacterium]
MNSKYISELQEIVGEKNVWTDKLERICYSRDMSVHSAEPDVIVFPTTTEEVSQIMALADANRIPVTPRGAGTSVTGAIIPCYGGIILEMNKMKQIKLIRRRDRYAVVEPGVILKNLNDALAPNFFFPPDPGSSAICTIGGMVSLNASGIRAVKYGTTRDYVLAAEIVLPGGRIIRTGTKAPKNSSGYDLTRILTNSEGTLGVITEITLKILPKPEFVAFATASFEKIEDAGEAITEIVRSGIQLSAGEIIDNISIKVVNEAMSLNLPEVESMLLLEIDGHKQAVKENMERVLKICIEHDGKDVHSSDDPSERAKMWAARARLVAALSRYKPGKRLIPIGEDIGVPISIIPIAVKEIQKIAKKNNITIASFGHIGDGNLHATFITDVRNKEEWEIVERVGREITEAALSLGGTISAEHGIGIAKAPFAKKEHGYGHQIMKEFKHMIDPNNIMNPGKLGFDDKKHGILDYFAFQKVVGSPSSLRSFGKKIDDEILICVQCGFCRLGCPVFNQTSLVSTNARGRVSLAYALMTNDIQPSKQLANRFYECTLCRNCTHTCPSGVDVQEIVDAVRKLIYKAGYLPDTHKALLMNMNEFGNPFGLKMDKVPKNFLLSDEEKKDISKKSKKLDALVYFGCLPYYQDLRMVPSILKILKSADINFSTLDKDESCCGYVSYILGTDNFEHHMEKLAKKIYQMEPELLVTPCSGCYKAFKTLYPQHVQFQIPVKHLVEYINDLVTEGKLEIKKEYPKKVAYHDPCDLGRHLGIYEPPRELLKKISGLELLEFKFNRELARCCGGGGGVSAFDPELSNDIAGVRIKEAMEIDTDVITSACPSCKDTFKKGISKLRKDHGVKMKILDIMEIIANVT